LAPHFKTIAEFRRNSGAAIQKFAESFRKNRMKILDKEEVDSNRDSFYSTYTR
jgi:hypothetical protein